jgi:hypothetical protein
VRVRHCALMTCSMEEWKGQGRRGRGQRGRLWWRRGRLESADRWDRGVSGCERLRVAGLRWAELGRRGEKGFSGGLKKQRERGSRARVEEEGRKGIAG